MSLRLTLGIACVLWMIASPAQPQMTDLATKENGAMVFVSSFANTSDLYSESLIDGDPSTAWQAFDISLPQWIELRWPNAVKLEGLVVHAAAPTVLQAWRAERWDNGKWLALGVSSSDKIGFPAVRVTRVRITITQATGLPLRLSSIEALGTSEPSIESLQPYWSASYIWHDETGHQILIGKPRYFRATFQIPDLKSVRSAFLQSRANDFYAAYLNGKKVDQGNVDIRAVPVKAALREGENVLAYEAEARSNPGWGLMELLGELTVNTTSGIVTVASGGTWKSSEKLANGWNLPAFDASAWTKAAVLLKPPQGPWARIPFHIVAEGETVLVQEMICKPPVVKPGDAVKVRLKLKPATKLAANYLIDVRAGEVEINRDRSDYEVAHATIVLNTPLNEWPADESRWVECTLHIPDYAPDGVTPIQLSAAALDGSGKALRFELSGQSGRPTPSGDLHLMINSDEAVARRSRPPTFQLGKNVPLFWALQSPSYERFHEYAKAGPKVYHIQMYPYRVEPDTDYSTPHLAFLDQHIRNLLRTVPDAQVIVEMDLRASGIWKRMHPEALLLDAFGQPRAESLEAKEYQDAVVYFLKRLTGFIQSQPYASRVIGYLCEIAPVAESCIGGVESNEGLVDRTKWTIGDWNPQAIEAFREFLRKKYDGDVTKLRAAWKVEQASSLQRSETNTSWKLALPDFDNAQPDRAQIVQAAPDHNLFRDPRAGRMRADYLEFLSSIVPTVFENKVAHTIKEATHGKALVGTYFGYVVEGLRGVNPPCAVQQNNHFGFMRIIDSPKIDFFVSPLQYEYSRLAGQHFFPFQPYASIGLHKKLYVAEMDYRTFICGDPTYGRQRSQQETVSVLQRDLASTMIGGSGAWFADWSSGTGRKSHGFFLDDAILSTIHKAYDIMVEQASSLQPSRGDASWKLALQKPAKKSAQIAVVVSSKSPWHQDCAYPSVIYNTLICSVIYQEMANIGAPFDIIVIDDLNRKEVRDQYKLFVFINPFYLTREESKWIEALKGGGRTLLWFYAPGYVSDEHGLSTAQVAKTTGMQIQLLNERSTPMFRAKDGGAVVTIESFGPQLNFSTIMPTDIYPNFAVEDAAATALGLDDKDRVRFAEKDAGSWRSFYSAVPNLPRTILRDIAQKAGVHLYAPLDVIVDANDRYLMLHNGNERPRQLMIRLPKTATVTDPYTGETVVTNQSQFELVLPKTTTRVFRLEIQ